MGTGAGASIRVVSELVNVHATLSIGILAGDIPADGGGRGFGLLLERHLSGDLGISSNDGD